MVQLVTESLNYDRESGKLFWKDRPRCHFNSDSSWKQFNSRFSGKEAGTIDKRNNTSYIRINISGNLYYAHSIVWFFEFGHIPDLIDHIDRNGLNNKIENLRVSSKSINAINSGLSIRNSTGVTGVFFIERDKVFCTQVRLNGKTVTISRGTLLDCAAARKSFESSLYLQGKMGYDLTTVQKDILINNTGGNI